MPGMYLKQSGFEYSGCGPFTKTKVRIQKIKETGDARYIYQNELYQTCFQYYMVYRDFKDLARKTASGKVLHDKAFNIAKNLNYDGYQGGLSSMVYKCFDLFSGIKNENISNQHLWTYLRLN